jgi:hypothetical protein
MRALILCLCLFWLACNTHPEPVDIGWNRVPDRLEFYGFTLKAPPDWKKIEYEENDQTIEGLSNGKDTLLVEYLGNNRSHKVPGDAGHFYAVANIDGCYAIVTIPMEQQGTVEIMFDDEPYEGMYITGYVRDVQAVLSIFESIHFPSGDPTKTEPLTRDRFSPHQLFARSEGRALFQEHCASCHSKIKWIIGPPLSPEYVGKKGEKWIIDWLRHKPAAETDSTRLPCYRAPYLNFEQIRAVVNYLKRPLGPVAESIAVP